MMRLPRTEYIIKDDGEFYIIDRRHGPSSDPPDSRPQSRTSTTSTHTLRAQSEEPTPIMKVNVTVNLGGDADHPKERKRSRVDDEENAAPDMSRSAPRMKTGHLHPHFHQNDVGAGKQTLEENSGNDDVPPGHGHGRDAVLGRYFEHHMNDNRDAQDRILIDLEDLEDGMEEVFNHQPVRPIMRLARDPILAAPWVEIDSIKERGMDLRPRKMVEFWDGSFLFIRQVIKNRRTGEVKLRGWQLKRSHSLNGMLPQRLNELCFIFEAESDDPRSIHEQSMVNRAPSSVAQLRKLIRTNAPFPPSEAQQRFFRDDVPSNEQMTKEQQTEYVKESGTLTVRWKFITTYDNAAERLRNQVYALTVKKRLEALDESECSPEHIWHPVARRAVWRDNIIPGGSSIGVTHAEQQIEEIRGRLNSQLHLGPRDHRACRVTGRRISQNRRSGAELQKFTFWDGFSGAGGTTRGAKMAGLRILEGLDKDSNSAQTWRRNFPEGEHFEMWAHDFVKVPGCHWSDIAHFSPPCQVWSPVHTRAGQDDEQNFNSLFSLEELLLKVRPRIATVEQTFGILHPKFAPMFNTAIVKAFTDCGYSVRWELVEFHRYGLAQKRKRLILIAACSGETLPELPAYTHSDNPDDGLKPLKTVAEVLRTIPANAPNHDPQRLLANRTFKQPWNPNGLAKCITCNGGEYGHPSGLRSFTHRELAALQSFPNDQVFYGGAIRKQIGNAVPPLFAKVLYKKIIKHLEEADGIEREVHALD
ncbi:S-adenosyl-L-methionine-dependent methyltransferase [Acephala macrosclerotiorum]|nr:S-adenosyl-L-methionine-dependent methyltransferase [Acephala macrosclerotiorum]